jgi:hypothetical protein
MGKESGCTAGGKRIVMSSAVFVVLNDLCLHYEDNPITGTAYDAQEWVKSFYQLLLRAQDEGVNGLRTYLSFDEIHLLEDYRLRDWSNDRSIDQDLRERIKEIFAQLAYVDEFPENQQGNPLIDCRFNDRVAYGIWGAIYLESFSISLLSDEIWDNHELHANVEEMDEETFEIDERLEVVRHLSQDRHLMSHQDWLAEQTKIVIPNGNSLWTNRKLLFPSLSFCKNTRDQIRSLTGHQLRQVVRRLTELESACKNWTSGVFDKEWLPNCTPESQATLIHYEAEHSFECDDGETRVFSLHIRFTPNAGRIFFYPHIRSSGDHVIFVGHIGKKLRTVNYPT